MKARITQTPGGMFYAEIRHWFLWVKLVERFDHNGVLYLPPHQPTAYFATAEEAEKAIRDCLERRKLRSKTVRVFDC